MNLETLLQPSSWIEKWRRRLDSWPKVTDCRGRYIPRARFPDPFVLCDTSRAFKGTGTPTVKLNHPSKQPQNFWKSNYCREWLLAVLCIEKWCHEFVLSADVVFVFIQILFLWPVFFMTNRNVFPKGSTFGYCVAHPINIAGLSRPYHILRLGVRGSVF